MYIRVLITCKLNRIIFKWGGGGGGIKVTDTPLYRIWDRFREKGPNAYIIKFPVRAIEM